MKCLADHAATRVDHHQLTREPHWRDRAPRRNGQARQGLEDHPHVTIMSDEIYGRMLYDGREHVSMLEYENLRDRVIMLDGWSKTYAMTGWRLGYAVWPDALVEHATRLAINCHSCVNAPTQWAGKAASGRPQDDAGI